MKWRYLLPFAGVFVTIVVVGAFQFAPYLQGLRHTREIDVTSNLCDALQKPNKAILVRSEKEMLEILRHARRRLEDDDPVRDMYGLAAAEKSMREVDFATECLVLIPFWQPADFGASMTPLLQSRRLTCQLSITKPFWTKAIHPANYFRCIAVVVPREQVDEVEVIVDQKDAEVLAVR